MEAPGERFNAGYCGIDIHSLKATIFVAPSVELVKNNLNPEAVLLHELLHVRLAHTAMIPSQEVVGHNLALENLIHHLTRALLGRTK